MTIVAQTVAAAVAVAEAAAALKSLPLAALAGGCAALAPLPLPPVGPRASATESWGANLPVAKVKNDLAASEKGVIGTLGIYGDCVRIRLFLEMLGEILRSCGLGCLLLRLGFGAGSWRL